MRRRLQVGIQWMGIILVGFTGCHMQEHSLRHPLQEEYVLPPSDDPRFSQPPQFPKEVLDQELLKKQPAKPGDQPGGPPRFGAGSGGPGMGGY
jgi:hypothetical protein